MPTTKNTWPVGDTKLTDMEPGFINETSIAHPR